MLVSHVIDHLNQYSSEWNAVVVYIYCDYRKQEEQTAVGLTGSVVKQLIQHQYSVPEKVEKMYEYHQKKETRPKLEELLEMTTYSIARLSRIFLIVDALDELGSTGKVRRSLIQNLCQLQDLHNFNLMTTSRKIPSLALDFREPCCMDLRANPGDVRKYVEGHIANLSKCVEKNARLQETIADTIVESVDGMYIIGSPLKRELC